MNVPSVCENQADKASRWDRSLTVIIYMCLVQSRVKYDDVGLMKRGDFDQGFIGVWHENIFQSSGHK